MVIQSGFPAYEIFEYKFKYGNMLPILGQLDQTSSGVEGHI